MYERHTDRISNFDFRTILSRPNPQLRISRGEEGEWHTSAVVLKPMGGRPPRNVTLAPCLLHIGITVCIFESNTWKQDPFLIPLKIIHKWCKDFKNNEIFEILRLISEKNQFWQFLAILVVFKRNIHIFSCQQHSNPLLPLLRFHRNAVLLQLFCLLVEKTELSLSSLSTVPSQS